MKIIEGTITAPKGFKATGAAIGIKKNGNKDLSLLISDVPAVVAGVFTTNVVKAAPVLWDMEIAAKGVARGVVVNSGNANACTGEQGVKDAQSMAATMAMFFGLPADEIMVCSTGVIGVPMPIELIVKGIAATVPSMGASLADGMLAAESIMTTDTFAKTIAVEIELSGKTVTIGGMAKGSGMIHPNMATMLGFITTDCAISHGLLQKALKEVANDTFNMVSVDGDTSTNDTLLVFANGAAGNPCIESENADYEAFKAALLAVNTKLAIDLARDGEGATKLMEVKVTGSASADAARTIAKSVISSNLFKAALFGADANWGRVLCAMGYSGAAFDPNGVTIEFRDESGKKIRLMDNGVPIVFNEELAKSILLNTDIYIDIMLSEGDGTATAWGCDLTYDYVKINGDYRS